MSLTVWDVGGQDHLRTLWHHYFDHVDGLVFVVDSADQRRFSLAKAELKGIYQHDSMKNVPMVILANKQDSKDAIKSESIADRMDLTSWFNGNFHVQSCCALTGDGLIPAFNTLAKLIRKQSSQRWSARRTDEMLFFTWLYCILERQIYGSDGRVIHF